MSASEMPAQITQDLEREFHAVAGWWLEHVVDLENGRIAGEVSNGNRVSPAAGLGLVYVARLLWFFSAAYRFRPNAKYRKVAALCRQVLIEQFTDRNNGGLAWSLDAEGRVDSRKKQTYGQSFAIYGLSEYFLAFGDREALEAAGRLMWLLETRVLDHERGGYVEALDADWQPLADVRLGETDLNGEKTMNTHLHMLEAYTNYHRAKRDRESAGMLERLLTLFLERFVKPHGAFLARFYDADWNEMPAACSYGHDIEASWLMWEAAALLGDDGLQKRLREPLLALAENVLANGIDEHGGVIHEGGGRDGTRVWWVQAEAMVGFANAWQMTGEQRFLHASLSCWDFIKEHQRDSRYGEWLWYSSLDAPGEQAYKAGMWKAPYHNGRALLEMIRRLA